MTEPLLLALTTGAVAQLVAWCREDAPDGGGVRARVTARRVGLWFAAACLTRYEAWPVTAAAIPAAAWARHRRGQAPAAALRAAAGVAAYPIAAAAAFMLFSRVVVGQWFVSSGFFVPDPTLATPLGSAGAIWEGATGLTGRWQLWAAAAGCLVLGAQGLFVRRQGDDLVAVSLAAVAALPWLAFLQGHPYRVRYMVPLLAAEAVAAGVLAGRARRAAPLLGAGLLLLAAVERGPFDPRAPMVAEAQWEVPHALGRRAVTACLDAAYDGTTIMASMGSLGHYMQELAGAGFAIRDFLHEGNGDAWLNALDGPRPYAGWMLIEEEAEGGDMLAQLARAQPAFLTGFTRVCAGGGVALYRRAPEPDMAPASGAVRAVAPPEAGPPLRTSR